MPRVFLSAFSLFVLGFFIAPAALAQAGPEAGPPSEASRRAELQAAWQAAGKAGTGGPHDVALIDQALLKLPAGFFFIPTAEGARVLRALGNVVNEQTLLGVVVGTRRKDDGWWWSATSRKATSRTDDARIWNADELLNDLKADADVTNKDRSARGFPQMEVVGWVEPPSYDAASHHLVWSALSKIKDEPDEATKSVNYNTYALGRDGYFSLNLLSDSNRINARHESPAAAIVWPEMAPITACGCKPGLNMPRSIWRWRRCSRS